MKTGKMLLLAVSFACSGAFAAAKTDKSLKGLAAPLEAFQSKKWPECFTQAQAVKLPDYKDHALWLKWECAQKILDADIDKGVTTDQLRAMSSETALLETKDPGSAFLKDALRFNVYFDQILAHRLVKQGKRLAAYQAYEKVLLRILQSTASGLGSSVAHVLSRSVSDIVEITPPLIKARQISSDVGNAWILRLIHLFPRKAKESELLAQKFPEMAALAKTAPSFEKFAQNYKAPDFDFDLFDQGWKVFLDGKFSDARAKWEELVTKYPKSSQRFRALYWIGEAYQREGSESKAKDAWTNVFTESKLTYYAILSYFKLKALTPETIYEPKSVEPVAQSRDSFLTPLELRKLNHGEALLDAGLKLLAQRELSGLGPREPLSSEYLYGLAKLQSRAEAHWSAFPVLGELAQRRWEGAFSNAMFDLIFPQTKWSEVQKQSAPFSLDPILFQGLIKQESGFEARAISTSNAFGLSQLIWPTALDMDPNVKRADLNEDAINLKLGAKYLSQLIKKFDGNWYLALSGYNWGPTSVQRFYHELSNSSKIKIAGAEYVESIPVKETREYVASILRNYFWYSRRINKTEVTGFDPYWKTPATN